MAITFKDGTRGYCLTGTARSEIWYAIEQANKIYQSLYKDCVITSLCDGKHGKHSRHYFGLAVDLRTRDFTSKQKADVTVMLAKALGDKYDVVLESDHLHIEFDPK